jgi:hypothetical protein
MGFGGWVRIDGGEPIPVDGFEIGGARGRVEVIGGGASELGLYCSACSFDVEVDEAAMRLLLGACYWFCPACGGMHATVEGLTLCGDLNG